MKDGDPVTALYPARGGIRFEHARVQFASGRAWAQTDKGWGGRSTTGGRG